MTAAATKWQKSDRFRLAKQQLCMCIMLFCAFLCHHCMTTTWQCLTSCFVEDVNTIRQRLLFSLLELWYSLLEFNSRKICQNLMYWTSWNKHNKVWSSANSLFKWCFHSHCCHCWLSILLTVLRTFPSKNVLYGYSLFCFLSNWKGLSMAFIRGM